MVKKGNKNTDDEDKETKYYIMGEDNTPEEIYEHEDSRPTLIDEIIRDVKDDFLYEIDNIVGESSIPEEWITNGEVTLGVNDSQEEFDISEYDEDLNEILNKIFEWEERSAEISLSDPVKIPNSNSIEKQEIGKNIVASKNKNFKNDSNKLNINNEQFFMTQPENNEVYFVKKQERNITYQDLVDFLNKKLPLIRVGEYFPTTENLKRDLPNCTEIGRHLMDNVSKWMSSIDLPFSNITEMLIHFELKDPISFQEKVNQFLDSKLKGINELTYIPTLNSVIEDSVLQDVTSDHITNWFRSRYQEGRILYGSLTELKVAAELVESVPVYEFLDEKKPLIEKFKFIPTTENIIQERPDFKDFKNLSQLIYTWLEQNNLPSITELKKITNQESYRSKLYSLLNPLKNDIENFDFPPTVENIKNVTDDFDNFDDLAIYISRWLNENDIAPNLTEYLHDFGIMSDSRHLKDFLDLKYPEIANGYYYATIKNLRRDQADIGIDIDSMTALNTVRANWYNKNFKKTMTQLIYEFDPTYDQLGYDLQWHGYPAQFNSQKLRVMNAEFQVFILINQSGLGMFNPTKKFNSLESLLKYLNRNERWKFVDMVTGEIFTLQDLYKQNIILHHINFRKDDLSPDNLVYIFKDTHGFINASKRYDKEILDFFTNLLKENIKSIKNNMIPRSWMVDWRTIASENEIRLPSNRYIKKLKRDTIINHTNKFRNLDYF